MYIVQPVYLKVHLMYIERSIYLLKQLILMAELFSAVGEFVFITSKMQPAIINNYWNNDDPCDERKARSTLNDFVKKYRRK
jgi:hypothetical protein